MVSIKDTQVTIHNNSINKEFWVTNKEGESEVHKSAFCSQLGPLFLCISELIEAGEALRHNNREEYVDGLIDCIVRVLDLCEHEGIDTEKELLKVMESNSKRPPMHNKAF